MLELAEKCFSQAKSLVKRAEGEPWLHSYMLGKASERLEKPTNLYLNYYQLVCDSLGKFKSHFYVTFVPYYSYEDLR